MIEFIKNIFFGKDVFIVAGGPSLIGFDFKKLDNKKTIAVNHSYEYLTKPDLLVYLDSNFIWSIGKKKHLIENFDFPVLTGPQGVYHSHNCHSVLHCDDPADNSSDKLFGNVTSAAFAISAALWAGAKKIYLLGVDGYFANNMDKHFYSRDFEKRKLWHYGRDNSDIMRFQRMKKTFDMFRDFKDKIINLSINSKINTFKKLNINEILA